MVKNNYIKYGFISLIFVTIINILPFIKAQNNFNIDLVTSANSIFLNEGFLISFKNTVIFMFIAIPVMVVLSFTLAYFTETEKLSFWVQISIILPIAIPVLAVSGFFKDILFEVFGRGNGGLFGVGIVYMWGCIGYPYLVFLISLKNRNKSIEEAACLDGAGKLKTIFRIILPTQPESIMLATILCIYNCLKIYRQTYAIFGEVPSLSQYMMQNYLQIKLKNVNLGQLIVSADIFLIFILVILIAIAVFGKIQKRKLMR